MNSSYKIKKDFNEKNIEHVINRGNKKSTTNAMSANKNKNSTEFLHDKKESLIDTIKPYKPSKEHVYGRKKISFSSLVD